MGLGWSKGHFRRRHFFPREGSGWVVVRGLRDIVPKEKRKRKGKEVGDKKYSI